MDKFYSLKKINSKNALYNMIIGQRSNGKTYSVIQQAIKAFFKSGARLAYIRRLKEDLTPRNIGELLTPHLDLISKLSGERYNSIIYYNREFTFCYRNERGEILDRSEQSIIKCFSLNTWESAKGADNGFFETVLFDEFLTRGMYLADEFIIFTQLLSSILRNRDGTKIYMLANTVNKYCPYFREMGLYNVDKMSQGTIDLYTYGDSDLTVAVEYCSTASSTSKINKYFAFNNPRLSMVTKGTWEIASYPHCPYSYDPSDIVAHCFIDFNGTLVHGEIVCAYDRASKVKHLFVMFYQQTKPIDSDKIKVLYSDKVSSNRLHCVTIQDRPTRAHKLFIDLILARSDFYNSNDTGEIVRNWKISQGIVHR